MIVKISIFETLGWARNALFLEQGNVDPMHLFKHDIILKAYMYIYSSVIKKPTLGFRN